jgi:hypothetical protein
MSNRSAARRRRTASIKNDAKKVGEGVAESWEEDVGVD